MTASNNLHGIFFESGVSQGYPLDHPRPSNSHPVIKYCLSKSHVEMLRAVVFAGRQQQDKATFYFE